ncbi:ABC transporter ATP-binding protein [Staphylococcus petrasii]|uniref:ABC transporter ATP-binding protein n=1 Tax=Staphylococcus petrasii TaxID=1276936 RepID=A0ABY2KVE4_9STAP|nr:ABC transporter ATP-binding protein [Staphylococcus petrasii]TGE16483.1 ABC transporter ATP-binding protein [Staphylococcus petrasii]
MSSLLEVKHLGVTFNYEEQVIEAVKDVSFKLGRKKILGIVGESGSGKSVTAKSIMGLLPDYPPHTISGDIKFNDDNLAHASKKTFQNIRGKDIAMIFQDPISSLNPRTPIGKQITEVILQHRKVDKRKAKTIAIDISRSVGIQEPEHNFNAYPYEFSGGMRQRVMIAMALVLEPQVLIADEPTTALDVSTQNQLLELMKQLYEHIETSILFITHDLSVVYQFCDDMIVMKQGEVVESGNVKEIFKNPKSDYTKRLINAIPDLHAPKSPRQLSDEVLLKFENISVDYPKGTGEYFRAVKNVSLDIKDGESLGIVGESGSGKSSLAKTVVGLNAVAEGTIWYKDIPLSLFSNKEMKSLRKDIQMIFQDPYASINPRFKVIDIIGRPLKLHGIVKTNEELVEQVKCLLERVGLDDSFIYRYPHELSGGQRQRVSIARAISIEPKVIVCDEAVSALDVSIQKEIIQLLKKLQDDMGITYLFITHDMGVIKEMCDRIAVMQNGEIVELNDVESVIEHPQAQYTKELIAQVPTVPKF